MWQPRATPAPFARCPVPRTSPTARRAPPAPTARTRERRRTRRVRRGPTARTWRATRSNAARARFVRPVRRRRFRVRPGPGATRRGGSSRARKVALRGFTARSAQQAIQHLCRHPRVSFLAQVQQNGMVCIATRVQRRTTLITTRSMTRMSCIVVVGNSGGLPMMELGFTIKLPIIPLDKVVRLS